MQKASAQSKPKQQTKQKKELKKVAVKAPRRQLSKNATTRPQQQPRPFKISAPITATITTTLTTTQHRSLTTFTQPSLTTFSSKTKFQPLFQMSKRFGGGWGYTNYTPAVEIEERIMTLLRDLPAVDQTKLTNQSHFKHDLGLDSLQQVELIMMLEHKFSVEINDDDAVKITSVPEAVHYFSHTPYTV